tara:strand:+ start:2075 stop:9250 length:7176 start_codon:yes stop_codon:yes gene_type:complete
MSSGLVSSSDDKSAALAKQVKEITSKIKQETNVSKNIQRLKDALNSNKENDINEKLYKTVQNYIKNVEKSYTSIVDTSFDRKIIPEDRTLVIDTNEVDGFIRQSIKFCVHKIDEESLYTPDELDKGRKKYLADLEDNCSKQIDSLLKQSNYASKDEKGKLKEIKKQLKEFKEIIIEKTTEDPNTIFSKLEEFRSLVIGLDKTIFSSETILKTQLQQFCRLSLTTIKENKDPKKNDLYKKAQSLLLLDQLLYKNTTLQKNLTLESVLQDNTLSSPDMNYVDCIKGAFTLTGTNMERKKSLAVANSLLKTLSDYTKDTSDKNAHVAERAKELIKAIREDVLNLMAHEASYIEDSLLSTNKDDLYLGHNLLDNMWSVLVQDFDFKGVLGAEGDKIKTNFRAAMENIGDDVGMLTITARQGFDSFMSQIGMTNIEYKNALRGVWTAFRTVIQEQNDDLGKGKKSQSGKGSEGAGAGTESDTGIGTGTGIASGQVSGSETIEQTSNTQTTIQSSQSGKTGKTGKAGKFDSDETEQLISKDFNFDQMRETMESLEEIIDIEQMAKNGEYADFCTIAISSKNLDVAAAVYNDIFQDEVRDEMNARLQYTIPKDDQGNTLGITNLMFHTTDQLKVWYKNNQAYLDELDKRPLGELLTDTYFDYIGDVSLKDKKNMFKKIVLATIYNKLPPDDKKNIKTFQTIFGDFDMANPIFLNVRRQRNTSVYVNNLRAIRSPYGNQKDDLRLLDKFEKIVKIRLKNLKKDRLESSKIIENDIAIIKAIDKNIGLDKDLIDDSTFKESFENLIEPPDVSSGFKKQIQICELLYRSDASKFKIFLNSFQDSLDLERLNFALTAESAQLLSPHEFSQLKQIIRAASVKKSKQPSIISKNITHHTKYFLSNYAKGERSISHFIPVMRSLVSFLITTGSNYKKPDSSPIHPELHSLHQKLVQLQDDDYLNEEVKERYKDKKLDEKQFELAKFQFLVEETFAISQNIDETLKNRPFMALGHINLLQSAMVILDDTPFTFNPTSRKTVFKDPETQEDLELFVKEGAEGFKKYLEDNSSSVFESIKTKLREGSFKLNKELLGFFKTLDDDFVSTVFKPIKVEQKEDVTLALGKALKINKIENSEDLKKVNKKENVILANLNMGTFKRASLKKPLADIKKLKLDYLNAHIKEVKEFIDKKIDFSFKDTPDFDQMISLTLTYLETTDDDIHEKFELLDRLSKKVPIDQRAKLNYVRNEIITKDYVKKFNFDKNIDVLLTYMQNNIAYITQSPDLAVDFLENLSRQIQDNINDSKKLDKILAVLMTVPQSHHEGPTIIDHVINVANLSDRKEGEIETFFARFRSVLKKRASEGKQTEIDEADYENMKSKPLNELLKEKHLNRVKYFVDLKAIEWLTTNQIALKSITRSSLVNDKTSVDVIIKRLVDQQHFSHKSKPFISISYSPSTYFFSQRFKDLTMVTRKNIFKNIFASKPTTETIKKDLNFVKKSIEDFKSKIDEKTLSTNDDFILVELLTAFDKHYSNVKYSDINLNRDFKKLLEKEIIHNQGSMLTMLIPKLTSSRSGIISKSLENGFSDMFRSIITGKESGKRAEHYYKSVKSFIRSALTNPFLEKEDDKIALRKFYTNMISNVSYDARTDVKDLMNVFNMETKGVLISVELLHSKLIQDNININQSDIADLLSFFTKKDWMTLDFVVTENFPSEVSKFSVFPRLESYKSQIFFAIQDIVKNKTISKVDSKMDTELATLLASQPNLKSNLLDDGIINDRSEVMRSVDIDTFKEKNLDDMRNQDKELTDILNKINEQFQKELESYKIAFDGYLGVEYHNPLLTFLKQRGYLRNGELNLPKYSGLDQFTQKQHVEKINKISKAIQRHFKKDPSLSAISEEEIQRAVHNLSRSFSVQTPNQLDFMKQMIIDSRGDILLPKNYKEPILTTVKGSDSERRAEKLLSGDLRTVDFDKRALNVNQIDYWYSDSMMNQTADLLTDCFHSKGLGQQVSDENLATIRTNLMIGIRSLSTDKLASLLLNPHLSDIARQHIVQSFCIYNINPENIRDKKEQIISPKLRDLVEKVSQKNNEYIPGAIISREYQQVIELVKQYLDRQLLLGNRFFSTKKSSLSPKQVEYIRDEIFSQYKELYGKKGANTILNGHNIKDFGLTPIPDTDAKLDALRLSFTQKFVSKENATWDNIVSFMRENNQNGNQLGLFEFFNLASVMDKDPNNKVESLYSHLLQSIVNKAAMENIPISQLLFSLMMSLNLFCPNHTLNGIIRTLETHGVEFKDNQMNLEFNFIDLPQSVKEQQLIQLWKTSDIDDESKKKFSEFFDNIKKAKSRKDKVDNVVKAMEYAISNNFPQKQISKGVRFDKEHWKEEEGLKIKIKPRTRVDPTYIEPEIDDDEFPDYI